MKTPQPKTLSSFFSSAMVTAPTLALLLLTTVLPARADQGRDNRAPDVPASLQVPTGNKVHFHAYAVGVQIYGWDAASSTWVFKAPEAVLYDSDGNIVGMHYAFAGPTRPAWESESGSLVVGARMIPGVTVDPNAIPWLLLQAVQTEGPGIFEPTTYVQRVNTTGGKAPAAAGTVNGQEARVSYTAEYYFYRGAK
jgi:hypothetical protein